MINLDKLSEMLLKVGATVLLLGLLAALLALPYAGAPEQEMFRVAYSLIVGGLGTFVCGIVLTIWTKKW